jgi:hypothetical protein
MPKLKPSQETIRTSIVIDDWGPVKTDDQKMEQLEHVFKQIKDGCTSGHEDRMYWRLNEGIIS